MELDVEIERGVKNTPESKNEPQTCTATGAVSPKRIE
jgi:hypothetical protein